MKLRDAFLNSARNATLSRDGHVRVPVRIRKSRTTMGLHGERTGKFMEHGGLPRSWRFIGLIVTRAKRRDERNVRARARKLLPHKNIFARETERSPSKTSREDEERRFRARRRRLCLRSRRRKVDGREFAEARFMDYRSSARDLSGQTERGVVEERFPSKTKLHARRKHVSM